ncbi:uncharacterized protein N7477_000879 [Penicillium maclennaniae]|uniref:uncharacterized protein n=1 Tax=Penicillium maclennaniae TaxID=1343394 RepID=UPI00253F8427|nr:uncharacterized protein N7477_000879 [Penicillium maclennaniae]KAJ5684534.1 hypothetical protein N7477_000879 [Penicillium maclennaniae]
MQQLDQNLERYRNSESLLHVICALGAKYIMWSDSKSYADSYATLMAGTSGPRLQRRAYFVELDDLSMEKLMAASLLHDHDLRIGSYASAFILSGITARMSQALQLNLEKSADVLCAKSESSSIDNEARRRSMWSCYVMDSWVGSGVNQLTLLEDRDLKIQLPCHSHNFSLGVPCITETLDEGKVLGFISKDEIPPFPAQNMGIEAYFIRLVSSRKKVLRCLDTSKPPWQSDSEFIQLTMEFDHWRHTLPQSLMWSPGNIYAHKESSQLGALTLLWCTYYQTLVDLYRIGMPVLFRIQKIITLPPDQKEFLENCRRACFRNAREVSSIICEALKHGIKILADTWLCIITHDSTRVMLHFLNSHTHSSQGLSQNEVDATIDLVQKNLEALHQMRAIVATAEHCYLSVIKMMAAAGIQHEMPCETAVNARLPHEREELNPTPGSPVQESPENVLNPLAIHPRASTRAVEGNPRRIHQDQQHRNTSLQGPNGLPGTELSYIAPNGATGRTPCMSSNGMLPLAASGLWDSANLAAIDILDSGIAPWTEEYLTDGQSGVDPFLFPF